LIGWRLLLIKANSAKKFKKILAIDELKKLQAGQGHDWPDTKILESNGFKVTGVVNYESLFKMLELNRIDYFSRSIAEIGPEEKIYKKYNILIEPSIAIHYPSVAYFFVNKKNIKLASAVELGLEKAIADGSFDKLFHKYYDDFLVKSKIKNRRIFELNNPLLPDNVPLSRKNLWVNPRAL
jgi:ABC-type amino acid transport substrate-binding protein